MLWPIPKKTTKQEQFNPITAMQIKWARYGKITMFAHTEQNNFTQILNFINQPDANLFQSEQE